MSTCHRFITLLTIIFFLAACSESTNHAASDIAAMQQRLQVLEDREAIRALILDYGWAHDHRDYQAYAALFAEDGEWVSGMGTAIGPDAIFAFLDDAIGHNPLPDGSGTYHIMSNEQIDVDGDTASAVTKWVYVTKNPDDTPLFTFIGHYYDEFVRENGEWKFQRRESIREIPAG